MANMIQSHAFMEKARKETLRELHEQHPEIESQLMVEDARDMPVLRRLASSREQMNLRRKVKKNIKKKKKRRQEPEPAMIVPTKLEEAPLRRQDVRTLNALRQRKADKNMIICIMCTSTIIIIFGITTLMVAHLYTKDPEPLEPFEVAGPIIIVCGLFLLCSLVEIALRLYKQTARVMDRSLLHTKNLHEVKHWIEPDLVPFGWGQFNYEEEARLLDDHQLRPEKPFLDRFV